MPVQNELSKQNIQDRYHGRNDPVAKKIMSTHAANMGLQPPEDPNIVRLSSLRRRTVADERYPDLPLSDLLIPLVHRAEHKNTCVEIVAFSTAVAAEVCSPRREDEVCGLTDSLPHHILTSIATDARS